MKILIISGFLGAGKTTFIKEMSRKIQRDFVVMENEYGETNMDSAFLKGQENLNIWELTEGCICCSTKSDFASSILTIANTLDPEYLIVEPTGVGVLSNVIRNIQQIEYERITLLSPITIVDADCFHRCMNDYPNIYMDQLRSAGTIVISKRSFISREEENQFVNQLKELAPGVQIQAEGPPGKRPERKCPGSRRSDSAGSGNLRTERYLLLRRHRSSVLSGGSGPRRIWQYLPRKRNRKFRPPCSPL